MDVDGPSENSWLVRTAVHGRTEKCQFDTEKCQFDPEKCQSCSAPCGAWRERCICTQPIIDRGRILLSVTAHVYGAVHVQLLDVDTSCHVHYDGLTGREAGRKAGRDGGTERGTHLGVLAPLELLSASP